ncbi:hypothetical protein GGQ88_003644 [Novosphingobium hassiacum]|uniref:Uncharacterized protein n=1 Tax=Novosphingobium hassiacum TaxID=173676 RepID=A0A7W6A034_9SPHN|nr:hypothetical protein [Novosphingobium hassiacum]MBB3862344.1 hypothetical protein [Novosphingobium hassiacum]
MILIILAVLAVAALKIAQRLSLLLIDAIATRIAAWYCWQILALQRCCLLAERRLMPSHLRLSFAMTAHHSLFPRSSMRRCGSSSRGPFR